MAGLEDLLDGVGPALGCHARDEERGWDLEALEQGQDARHADARSVSLVRHRRQVTHEPFALGDDRCLGLGLGLGVGVGVGVDVDGRRQTAEAPWSQSPAGDARS